MTSQRNDSPQAPMTCPQQPASKLLKAIISECQGEVDCELRGNAKDLAKRILYYIQCDTQEPPPPAADALQVLDELVKWLQEDRDSTFRITGMGLISHVCVLDKIAALRRRGRE